MYVYLLIHACMHACTCSRTRGLAHVCVLCLSVGDILCFAELLCLPLPGEALVLPDCCGCKAPAFRADGQKTCITHSSLVLPFSISRQIEMNEK